MAPQPLKTPPPKPLPFATRIPSRSPEWKFHTGRGHASNALSQRRNWNHAAQAYREQYAELWQMNAAGEWEIVRVQGE